MNRRERILEILEKNLNPKFISVVDFSSEHSGHSGSKPEGETHFRVTITHPSEISLVSFHRRIYNLLHLEFCEGLHALEILPNEETERV